MTSRLGTGKSITFFYSVCVNWAGMALYYATPYMGWHVGGPGMRAGQQSHSCTHVSHDDCTGLGMSAARLTDYHGAECMNVNDVQAVGRACPLKHKARRITVRKVHHALTSPSDFIPRLCSWTHRNRRGLKDIYWKKTTQFCCRFIWLQPPPSGLQRQTLLQRRKI